MDSAFEVTRTATYHTVGITKKWMRVRRVVVDDDGRMATNNISKLIVNFVYIRSQRELAFVKGWVTITISTGQCITPSGRLFLHVFTHGGRF